MAVIGTQFILMLTAVTVLSTVSSPRLDDTRPAVFITLERREDATILLRIRNNTRWTVKLPTALPCVSSAQTSGPCLENSRSRLIDGRSADVKYVVEPLPYERIVRLPCGERPAAETSSETAVRLTYNVPPHQLSSLTAGESAVFVVRAQELAGEHRIYVPFVFDWESERNLTTVDALQHRAYFTLESTPPAKK